MRESTVEREVCKFAVQRGWLVRKMSYIGRRGCPDRFFFRKKKLIIIEFKRPDKNCADPQQAREHERLNEQGFLVHIINDIDVGKALLA